MLIGLGVIFAAEYWNLHGDRYRGNGIIIIIIIIIIITIIMMKI